MKKNKQIENTTNLVTGVVGLGAASAVGATLPGLAGTITMGGTMPIAATSLMGSAASYGATSSSRRRRRKR